MKTEAALNITPPVSIEYRILSLDEQDESFDDAPPHAAPVSHTKFEYYGPKSTGAHLSVDAYFDCEVGAPAAWSSPSPYARLAAGTRFSRLLGRSRSYYLAGTAGWNSTRSVDKVICVSQLSAGLAKVTQSLNAVLFIWCHLGSQCFRLKNAHGRRRALPFSAGWVTLMAAAALHQHVSHAQHKAFMARN